MINLKKINILFVDLSIICISILCIAIQMRTNCTKWLILRKNINILNTTSSEQKIIENLQQKVMQLTRENNNLRDYKNIYQSIQKKTTIKAIAKINYLNKSNNGFYFLVTTNKNVNINDLAVDSEWNLIGRVVQTSKNDAKIQLLLDRHSNIPVVSGESNGIIFGTGEKNCMVEYQNLSPKQPNDGDTVLTSGDEGLTLKGITIGILKISNGRYCVDGAFKKDYDNLAII